MAQKVYRVTVNASPKYPIKVAYTITAGNWATAIARAVKKYFKEHKGLRSLFCSAYAEVISKKLEGVE